MNVALPQIDLRIKVALLFSTSRTYSTLEVIASLASEAKNML